MRLKEKRSIRLKVRSLYLLTDNAYKSGNIKLSNLYSVKAYDLMGQTLKRGL